MSRVLGAACVVLATIVLPACSSTREVYVGSHIEPDEPAPAESGGPAPTPEQDAGPIAGRGAGGAEGSVGVAGAAGVAGPAGSSAAPPMPVPMDAAVPPACESGTADCDGRADNGCEADVTSDIMNCGDCGVACQSADCSCVDGVRVLVCPPNRADCDQDPSNGCETDLANDAEHCGTCDRSCTGGAGVARATCTARTCVLTCALPTLLGDCDGDASNGCEADLFHDADNCSACGMECNACVDARCL